MRRFCFVHPLFIRNGPAVQRAGTAGFASSAKEGPSRSPGALAGGGISWVPPWVQGRATGGLQRLGNGLQRRRPCLIAALALRRKWAGPPARGIRWCARRWQRRVDRWPAMAEEYIQQRFSNRFSRIADGDCPVGGSHARDQPLELPVPVVRLRVSAPPSAGSKARPHAGIRNSRGTGPDGGRPASSCPPTAYVRERNPGSPTNQKLGRSG
jgi:hypothetical protein